MDDLVYSGKIKNWFEDKGYGFIVCSDITVNGGSDVFVHISQCGGNAIKPGTPVSFSFGLDKRSGKMSAQSVQIVSG